MAQPKRKSARRSSTDAPAARGSRARPATRLVEVVPASEVEVLDASSVLVPFERNDRLTRPPTELPASLRKSAKLLEDLRQAGRLAERAVAERTIDVYRKNLVFWEAYCKSHGAAPYPPEKAVVLGWLASMATVSLDAKGNRMTATGLHPKTIIQRLAALNKACAAQGWPRPGDDPDVAELIAGIRRTLGIAAKRQVAPLDPPVMRDVLAASYRPTLEQLRDRALVIALAHAEARPASMLRVPWDAITIDADEVVIAQPPPARHGTPIELRYPATGDELCPVEAMRQLVDHPGVRRSGPVFARVLIGGGNERYADTPLSRPSLSSLLARRAADAAADEVTADTLAAIVAALMSPLPADVRDRAMLLTALLTAARRSNVCALTWGDALHDRRGLRITFTRTKTDQEGAGTFLWLPPGRSDRTCPIKAWLAWRDLTADLVGGDPVTTIPDSPMFPAIDRHGNVTFDANMTGDAFALIVKRRVAAAGYDPALFAGHSLRAGFITGAAENDARPDQIQAVSGHKNLDVMMGYIRSVEAWKDNPAALLGL